MQSHSNNVVPETMEPEYFDDDHESPNSEQGGVSGVFADITAEGSGEPIDDSNYPWELLSNGTKVCVPDQSGKLRQAIVKFVGYTHLGIGLVVGVDLIRGGGGGDGGLHGFRYFQTSRPDSGLIVRPTDLVPITDRNASSAPQTRGHRGCVPQPTRPIELARPGHNSRMNQRATHPQPPAVSTSPIRNRSIIAPDGTVTVQSILDAAGGVLSGSSSIDLAPTAIDTDGSRALKSLLCDCAVRGVLTHDDANRLFVFYDSDEDGILNNPEFLDLLEDALRCARAWSRPVCQQLTYDIDAIKSAFDTNGDGQVDAFDFWRWVQRCRWTNTEHSPPDNEPELM